MFALFRPNLSFNFNFFLHGDSKVCASIDVQQHKEIFQLTSDDLESVLPIQGEFFLISVFTNLFFTISFTWALRDQW